MRRYVRRTLALALALALAFALALALLPAGAGALNVGDTFSAVNGGQTIWYRVTNDNPATVEVIANPTDPHINKYTGAINIPATATNAGTPYQVAAIGADAFSDCDALTSVTIPEGVITLGDSAFFSCNELASVTLPSSLETIGNYAFQTCKKLVSISLPGGLKAIGVYAFTYSGLTEITVPGSVQAIADRTFFDCASLKSATLEPGVQSIGANAFRGCNALTGITIPDGVKTIGAYAFTYSGITAITVPGSVQAIADNTFEGCASLKSATLEPGVQSIGANAFKDCNALTGITIPDGVKTIGANAFAMDPNNNQFSSVTLPDSITSIGADAFAGCSRLRDITLTVAGNTTVDAAGFTPEGGAPVALPNTVTGVELLAGGQVANNTGKNLDVTTAHGDNVTLSNGQPYPIGKAGNQVTGLAMGAVLAPDTQVGFTVVGAGMDNLSPVSGDTRYLPKGWRVNPSGTFPEGGPYTGGFNTSGLPLGKHTLEVDFQLQRFSATNWEDMDGMTDMLEIEFTVALPPPPPEDGGDSYSPSGGPTVYSLVVEGGTGTGSYPAGHVVTIRANGGAPFSQWVLRSGVGTIGDPYSRETTFTMGSGGAVVTALGAAPPKTGDGPALWLGLALVTLAAGAFALAKRKKA